MFGGSALALLLREDDVRSLLPMADALRLVEDALRQHGEEKADNRPRTRIPYPGGMFHYMAAAVPQQRAVGLKAYASSPSGVTFVVLLFDTESSVLLSILEADWLGRIRTGAASGVATRMLAPPNARVLGVIGAGGQAETQIRAITEAVRLDSVKVFSPTREHREALVAHMQPEVRPHLTSVPSAEEAVRDSDVVVTVTTAGHPVFDGRWLEPDAHVNAVGGNRPNRREIDNETVSRAAFIAVDSIEQAKHECGDLILADRERPGIWSHVVELGSILAGTNKGRTGRGQITLFESQGIAVEDIAVARYIYDRACEAGVGQSVNFGGGD